METYATRLQPAMADACVSAAQLAAELGISYQAVKKVLAGKSSGFRTVSRARAARFLKVMPDWLSTGDGPREASQQPATSNDAADLAWLLDQIPDRKTRLLAFIAATQSLLEYAQAPAAQPTGTHTAPGPAETPPSGARSARPRRART